MNAVPPKISQASSTSLNALFAGIVLAAVVIGFGAVIFFFNPATHAFFSVCQFHKITGLNCPGCGATRAAYALLHGQFLTALRDNALFVFLLAAAGIHGSRLAFNRFHGRPVGEIMPVKILWLLLFVALAFTVLRNLPLFSFLSPAA
jgi:hypothetical protein